MIELLVLAVVKQEGEPRPRVDAKMVLAFRTNLKVFVQRFAPDHLPAMLAFEPKTFCPDTTLLVDAVLHPRLIAGEPCHFYQGSSVTSNKDGRAMP